MYDSHGNQLDDINSVTEFIMVKLGCDHHADDEDDDSGQNLHLVKLITLYCESPFSIIKTKEFLIARPSTFGKDPRDKIADVCYDIIIPPPKNRA